MQRRGSPWSPWSPRESSSPGSRPWKALNWTRCNFFGISSEAMSLSSCFGKGLRENNGSFLLWWNNFFWRRFYCFYRYLLLIFSLALFIATPLARHLAWSLTLNWAEQIQVFDVRIRTFLYFIWDRLALNWILCYRSFIWFGLLVVESIDDNCKISLELVPKTN